MSKPSYDALGMFRKLVALTDNIPVVVWSCVYVETNDHIAANVEALDD